MTDEQRREAKRERARKRRADRRDRDTAPKTSPTGFKQLLCKVCSIVEVKVSNDADGVTCAGCTCGLASTKATEVATFIASAQLAEADKRTKDAKRLRRKADRLLNDEKEDD